MSAMKEYAMGVCDAHPKEMYDLYDLLCGSEDAATVVATALLDRNGEDVSAARAVWELVFEMDEILENVSQEDSLIMLTMISNIADNLPFMEEELSYWRERWMRHETRAVKRGA